MDDSVMRSMPEVGMELICDFMDALTGANFEYFVLVVPAGPVGRIHAISTIKEEELIKNLKKFIKVSEAGELVGEVIK